MTVFQHLMSRTCELIDLRSYDRGAGLIAGARHVPSSDFPMVVTQLVQQLSSQSLVVFTCQYSAHRAPQCANWYREMAPPHQRVAILVGGFSALAPTRQRMVAPQPLDYDAFALETGARLA